MSCGTNIFARSIGRNTTISKSWERYRKLPNLALTLVVNAGGSTRSQCAHKIYNVVKAPRGLSTTASRVPARPLIAGSDGDDEHKR